MRDSLYVACSDIISALKAKDFMFAKGLAAFTAEEGASWHFLRLMEHLIDLIACGELDFE